MKLTSSGIILFLCLVVCDSFMSCASMPTLPANSNPAVDPAITSIPAQVTPAPETKTVAETAAQPVSELAAQPVVQPVPEPTQTALVQNIQDTTVEATAPDLSVPPGEKLLYFYPEPDFQYIVPVTPAATPVPSVVAPVKTVPAAGTAKAATAPATKAPAKTDATNKTDTASTVVDKPVDNVLPGIWESEPVAPTQSAEKTVPSISPSRKVTVAKGQTLEVWYPGTGWVYLGDVSAQNGLSYETRKLADKDTLFTFKALKPGNYLLEFSRFDVLEDSFLSDALAVTVTDTPDTRIDKVRAPDYRSTTPGSNSATTTASGGSATTTGSTITTGSTTATGSITAAATSITEEPSLTAGKNVITGNSVTTKLPNADAKALLDKAKTSLAAGDAASALAALESFFSVAIDSIDEGLFLKGQAYEANGTSRDIRKALDAYTTLTSAYPESARWKEADARIRYINQFYLKIR